MSRLLYDRLTVYMRGTAWDRALSGATVIQNYDALRSVWFEHADVEALPSFAPIYPKMFIEVNLPFLTRETYGGVLISAIESRDGMLPASIEPMRLAVDTPVRWSLGVSTFIDPKVLPRQYPFSHSIVVLDETGHPIPLAHQDDPQRLGFSATWLDPRIEEAVQQVYEVAAGIIEPGSMDTFSTALLDAALFTVGLLHVKNVQAVDVEPNHKQSRKYEKHYGQPLTRYKVLKVTGKGASSGQTIGERVGGGSPKSLHWCRGHFRTYDDSAPLFGKLTGTFYIDPHMRGSRQRGEVIKDYEVDSHV